MEIGHLMDQQRDQVRVLKERTIQIADKDKQRRTLISNIAHQVSRPIMELKNSAYTLSHYGFSEENYRDFRACLMELERGCRNFNIYEQLSTDLKKDEDIYQASASFSIKEIIDKAHDRLRPFLKSKNIEISVKVCTEKGQEIPKVIGNPEGTLECVVNVLHNSIKYSIGSRPIEVNISHTSKLWVYVRVTNYGIYLLDSDRERIFDETIRGETAKTVSIEGSGIGLYISRKLINLHNGHISVESSEPSEPRKDGVPRWKTTFLISLKC
jgi:signal transduction histidine kinase